MTYKLNLDDYYDYKKLPNLPKAATQIYAWVCDFNGRRGFRQNFESYFSYEEQEELMNQAYLYVERMAGEVDTEELLELLKRVPGNSDTISEIDDETMAEIKAKWSAIFN